MGQSPMTAVTGFQGLEIEQDDKSALDSGLSRL
jgi:hypothetical protein